VGVTLSSTELSTDQALICVARCGPHGPIQTAQLTGDGQKCSLGRAFPMTHSCFTEPASWI
jgi:hypothetical protein